MQTGELILLLLLILVAAVVVAFVLRRSAAKRAEHQRVEAAGLRSEADAIAATMSGQTAFAQQAEERADVARVEAQAKNREASELEAEAAERRATAEATRHDYESTMRRADDIDPDVKESDFAPAPDQPSDAVAESAGTSGAAAPAAPEAATGGEPAALPMTRSERRQAREEAEAGITPGERAAEAEPEPEPKPKPEPEPEPEMVATGAAAAGWASPEQDADPQSERIASAAGFRDEVATGASPDEVSPPAPTGSGEGMNDPAGTAATDLASYDDDALSQDVEIPTNEWGGPREDAVEPITSTDDSQASELTIIADPEDYAATEPLPANDEGAPVVDEGREEQPAEEQLPEEQVTAEQVAAEGAGRRVSGFLELRDGGFGVGSAAPIHDGAQPLDHPVQAYRDTMTFRAPGEPGYDSVEPDVWFYDAGAAERSGFRHADG